MADFEVIGVTSEEELQASRRHARELEQARGLAEEIEVAMAYGPWLVDGQDRLFRAVSFLGPTDHFAVASDGSVVWLERPPDPHPRSLAGLKSQEAHQAEQASADAERSRAELMARPLVPVALDDVRDGPTPSLREAARLITESHGGELRERSGRLEILVRELPPAPAYGLDAGADFRAAVEVLRLAESVVLDCLKRDKPLPDKQIGPTGLVVD